MAIAELLSIPPVRSFLLDGKVLAEFREIAKKNSLPTERAAEFLDLCNAVLDGTLPMAEVPGIIAQAFGVDEKASHEISADIFGYRLLPIASFVPGVQEQIAAWGRRPEDYPLRPIGKEKISAVAWARRLNDDLALGFSDVLVKRLALLLEGRISGEKTADTVKTFLGRPLTIGGLALPKEKIDGLMNLVEKDVPYVEIISEADFMKLQADQEAAEEESAEEEAPVETVVEISPSHELAAEVPVAAFAKALPGDLQAAVNAVVDGAKEILLAKNVPLEKFRSLAETRIRGVRDPGKTRDVLEKDYALTGADLRVVLDVLEAAFKKYHASAMAEGEPAEEQGKTEVSPEKEAAGLDQKFAQLTKEIPAESVEPLLPGARVSAAREAVMNAAEAPVVKPKPVKVELTVGSVPPKAPARKFSDVVPASRLMGPVDQLGSMSPIEFRRLSSDPAEAAKRVEDLLSALMATGYEERVRGISAWRKSPMNQLYLEISEEALSDGTPLPDVCSKRRKEGKDCLSPAEIKAIIGLNAKLRF